MASSTKRKPTLEPATSVALRIHPEKQLGLEK
jgi:hypothetical protein